MPSRTHAKRRPGRPTHPVERSHLLALAAKIFAEEGYAGASMSTIADAAGLRKASLFHHFPRKEDLYLEILASLLTDLHGLVDAVTSAEGEFPERLDRLGELVVRSLGERPPIARLLFREMMDAGPFVSGPGGVLVQGTLQATSTFLSSGMRTGAIPEQDPGHLAMSLIGLHMSWFAVPDLSSEIMGCDPFSKEGIAQRVAAMLPQVRRICGVPVAEP